MRTKSILLVAMILSWSTAALSNDVVLGNLVAYKKRVIVNYDACANVLTKVEGKTPNKSYYSCQVSLNPQTNTLGHLSTSFQFASNGQHNESAQITHANYTVSVYTVKIPYMSKKQALLLIKNFIDQLPKEGVEITYVRAE